VTVPKSRQLRWLKPVRQRSWNEQVVGECPGSSPMRVRSSRGAVKHPARTSSAFRFLRLRHVNPAGRRLS